MKYYRVKPEYDNYTRYGFNSREDGIFVANELYTEREIKKFTNGINKCEIVEIPKTKIYFFFGARFSS